MTWLSEITLETVVVHTTHGASLRGNKLAVYKDCIVLRDAVALDETGLTALDGNILIPRERVLFMQVVDGEPS